MESDTIKSEKYLIFGKRCLETGDALQIHSPESGIGKIQKT
jgi:hypothetical protein